MTPKEFQALNRLIRRMEHLATEVMDCRAEMKEFGFDFGLKPIDPANFPIEVELLVDDLKEKLQRESAAEMLHDLPF